MFKPTYLYIKTHNVTGLKYFGKTVNKNPHQYRGSGTRWLNHLNYHGNDVSTEIVGYYINENECTKAAKQFSRKNKIVESEEWANLEIEDGLTGGFIGAIGKKNTQFGTMWITDGTTNAKILKTQSIPSGWNKGRTMPSNWGDNVRRKLKGRTHQEMLGVDKATELKAKKRQRMVGNTYAKK